MIIKCESCHSDIEVPDGLPDGQAVRCPYCQTKFIYAANAYNGATDDKRYKRSSARQTIIDMTAEFWSSALPFCRHAVNSWISAWKSMFDFGGRMPRREYLEFAVFHYLGMELFWRFFVKDFIGKDSLVSDLSLSIFWIMLFTLISATVRRLHDTNRSGKWLLLLIPIAIAVDSTVNNWLPLDEIALFGIGLMRTRDEGNSYSPFRSTRWPLVALLLFPVLVVTQVVCEICGFGNAGHKDWPSCRQYRDFDALSRFDSSVGATKNGAFGFMWGEWPLSKEHKPPCKVKYRIADVWNLYSELELYYGEKGLSSFTFYGYGGQEIEGLPPPSKNGQQNALRKRMAYSSPIFQRMCRMAKAVTGLTFTAFEMEGKMIALPLDQMDDATKKVLKIDEKVIAATRNNGAKKCFATLRMDLAPTKNPMRVFFVCQPK